MRRVLGCALVLLLAAGAGGQQSQIRKLRNSKHDFSQSSGAAIKATSLDATCVFCHAPHRAQAMAPLWNHSLPQGVTYQVYQSSTEQSPVAQPGGGSKLCLSCHDGTVALGDTVNNGQIPFQGMSTDQKLPATSPSNLAGPSLSLASNHPVGFVPSLSNSQIMNPPAGDPVKLDSQGMLQCTTCHDPHVEDNDPVELRFLMKNNSGSALCTTCHDPRGGAGSSLWSWSGTQGQPSSHKTSAAAYTSETSGGASWLGSHTGYTTVAQNGCGSCHRSHTAHETARLLKGETDQVCFQCHDGNPQTAIADVKSEFTRKPYTHPSLGPQPDHDPAEAPDQIVSRHAACDDCHNPHAARSDSSPLTPPQLSGALLGESGINSGGAALDPRRGTAEAQYEYEICFKCHSYNLNQPQQPGYGTYGALPSRQTRSLDLRQAFANSPSWHPVVRPRGLSTGPGGDVPSLITDAGVAIPGRILSSASQIYCTDCHNSDDNRNLGPGNTGPVGPHGSVYPHILERNYQVETPMGAPGHTAGIPYSSANYALCLQCHSEQSLLNDESFPHREHMQVTSCATCHDPHGVPNGSAVNNAALIDFDLNIVAPYQGQMQFVKGAGHHGTCTLTCHNQDHASTSY